MPESNLAEELRIQAQLGKPTKALHVPGPTASELRRRVEEELAKMEAEKGTSDAE